MIVKLQFEPLETKATQAPLMLFAPWPVMVRVIQAPGSTAIVPPLNPMLGENDPENVELAVSGATKIGNVAVTVPVGTFGL